MANLVLLSLLLLAFLWGSFITAPRLLGSPTFIDRFITGLNIAGIWLLGLLFFMLIAKTIQGLI